MKIYGGNAMKRTKIFGLWLLLILTISMAMWVYPACKKEAEQLTYGELKFVGTWVLDEIGYIDYSGADNKIYRYPSSSDTFNSICEQYLDKTKIVFNDSKKDGEISGALYIGNQKYDFGWHGWELNENAPRIDFVRTFKLLIYTPENEGRTSASVSNALIMDGKLYISPTTFMIYVFKRQ